MGLYKAKKPMFPKEFVWPALMIKSSADSFMTSTPAQDRPKNFINQAKPYSSLHPVLQGLQHALCPYRTFHPVPLSWEGFSRLLSLSRHCPGFGFIQFRQSTSTFLHPLTPRALPRCLATMGALSSASVRLFGFPAGGPRSA